MIVLESVYKTSHGWVDVLIFYILLFRVVYLAWCDFMVGITKEQQQCHLLVLGYHQWWELDLWLWSWDKATIPLMEKSKLTKTEKGEICEEQSQEHAYLFLWHHGIFRKKFVKPNSQFRILLCVKCAKTLPRTLATKELIVTSWQCTVSHFHFHQGSFDQKQHDCCSPPTLLAWLGSLWLFCFPDWR
jgi:hypothetical protein